MNNDYSNLKRYHPIEDLSWGCGLPTQFAKISNGDMVIDLGSGADNDAFMVCSETGGSGKGFGIDFTEAMMERAWNNAEKLGFHDVDLHKKNGFALICIREKI